MRIALDAMGSDNCPAPDVEGGVLAAREFGDTILLVGDEKQIREQLAKHDTTGLKIEVIHAPDAIAMTDKPADVGKSKPNSSMHVGMTLVKDGQADAFVTAGNTGAVLAIATLFTLRRIPGVKRPALSAIVGAGEHTVVLLDVGANADTKAEWLAQFAIMGQIYAQKALGLANPRIGLLSNGEEESKGSEEIQQANELLQRLPMNFVGNVEPKDITDFKVDVVVSDGFTGNIFIKTAEAIMSLMGRLIRQEIKQGVVTSVGGLLAKPALRRVARQLDPEEIGGAPLLGVNGVVIIGHGRSSAHAIKNAVRQARLAVNGGVITAIREGLNALPE